MAAITVTANADDATSQTTDAVASPTGLPLIDSPTNQIATESPQSPTDSLASPVSPDIDPPALTSPLAAPPPPPPPPLDVVDQVVATEHHADAAKAAAIAREVAHAHAFLRSYGRIRTSGSQAAAPIVSPKHAASPAAVAPGTTCTGQHLRHWRAIRFGQLTYINSFHFSLLFFHDLSISHRRNRDSSLSAAPRRARFLAERGRRHCARWRHRFRLLDGRSRRTADRRRAALDDRGARHCRYWYSYA